MSETETETQDVPEQGDEAEAPEPDTEPDIPFGEPEQAAPVEPVQVGTHEPDTPLDKQQQAKIKGARTTWNNAVHRIFGDAADTFPDCPVCAHTLPGYIYPPQLEQPVSAMQQHIFEAISEPMAPDYREARQVQQCQACSGWGKVLSGSQIAHHKTVTCSECKGYGYVPPPGPTGNGPVPAAVVPNPDQAPDEPLTPEDTDAWGSPKLLPDGQENPNWGRAPSYKIPGLP